LGQLDLILTAFNWGAICFVSGVHYPLFADVSVTHFVNYHRKHVSRTTLLLGTSLSLEMFLTGFRFLSGPHNLIHSMPLVFLILGWLITFLISVPQHRQLEHGFSEKAHRILLFSNWARVATWGFCLLLKFVPGIELN